MLLLAGLLVPWGASPAAGADCVVTAAGDIAAQANPVTDLYINAKRTGDVVRAVDPTYALTLGDNAYEGLPDDFATMYEPTWGSFKDRTKPSAGNHEYGIDNAEGYFGYFFGGQRTGNEYYATTCGAWRLYSLSCEIACGAGSAQLAWLQQDLAAHPGMHYLGYLHRPRFTSGIVHGPNAGVSALWTALQDAGGDVMVSGHSHNYERFAKQDASGVADAGGLRQFVVGTGGVSIYGFGGAQPNSEVRDAEHFGVLKLVLGSDSYSWEFISAGRHLVNGVYADDPDHPLGTVLDSGTTPTNTTATGNRAPAVSAGPDVVVGSVPGSVALDGSVSDDGLPGAPAVLTSSWSVVSGPGEVVFADAGAVDTTASVSVAGTYVVRLSASDGELSGADEVVLSAGPAESGTVEVRVVSGGDDAEQALSGVLRTARSSSDLELGQDKATAQVVGTRFASVRVPQGATVTAAWVQFRADEVGTAPASLTVRAQAADDAAPYASTANNIGARPVTDASVAWTPAAWDTVGVAGTAQRTPDLAAVLQEVVSRPGWVSGNAISVHVTGTGTRTADSYEGGATSAPLLHVEYVVP